MGWLDAFTGKASKNASAATVAGLDKGAELLEWGGDSSRHTLEKGLDSLRAAGALYKPMQEIGLGGVNAYQTAMGLGPGGSAGALEAFRNTPGYEFARSQGEDSVMRNAAARGMLAGGNTSADLMKYGTGLADQTYGNYLTRLNPLMAMYGTGIAGEAGNKAAETGVYGNTADSYMREALGRSGIAGRIGEAQAGGIMGAANAQAGTINKGLDLVASLAGMPGGMPGTSFGGDLFKRYVQGAVPAQWG